MAGAEANTEESHSAFCPKTTSGKHSSCGGGCGAGPALWLSPNLLSPGAAQGRVLTDENTVSAIGTPPRLHSDAPVAEAGIPPGLIHISYSLPIRPVTDTLASGCHLECCFRFIKLFMPWISETCPTHSETSQWLLLMIFTCQRACRVRKEIAEDAWHISLMSLRWLLFSFLLLSLLLLLLLALLEKLIN